jgi:hypothetical protein
VEGISAKVLSVTLEDQLLGYLGMLLERGRESPKNLTQRRRRGPQAVSGSFFGLWHLASCGLCLCLLLKGFGTIFNHVSIFVASSAAEGHSFVVQYLDSCASQICKIDKFS